MKKSLFDTDQEWGMDCLQRPGQVSLSFSVNSDCPCLEMALALDGTDDGVLINVGFDGAKEQSSLTSSSWMTPSSSQFRIASSLLGLLQSFTKPTSNLVYASFKLKEI